MRSLGSIVRALLTALLCASLVLSPSFAGAAPATSAELRYTRKKGAESCPDETAFRHAVEAEVGRDPFVEGAETTIVVVLGREGPVFTGEVQHLNRAGANTWSRDRLTRRDCAVLVQDVALAVSIELSPPIEGRPQPPVVPVASKPPKVLPIELRGALGGAMLGGLLPKPSASFTLGLGVRREMFSLMLEAYGALPVSYKSSIGEVSALVGGGSIVPCLHWSALLGCGVVTAGVMRGSGASGIPGGKTDIGAFLGVGARVGGEIPVVPHLSIRVAVDLLGTAARPALHVDAPQKVFNACASAGVGATCLWRAMPAFMSAGAAIVGYFGGPDDPSKKK